MQRLGYTRYVAQGGAAFAGAPPPAGLSADERKAYDELVFFYKHVYYAFLMGSRPQTLTALTDSPVGLATFMIDHDARTLELIARASTVSAKASHETTCSITSSSSG